MRTYNELYNIIYSRWEKDDCDDIIHEIFDYMVYDEILREIMGLDDEEITKDRIIEIARGVIKDDAVIDDARELSECFSEEC